MIAYRSLRGFTLLEVMVATMVAGVSFGAICSLMAQSVRTANITGRYSRATLLAESKLDELTLKKLDTGTQKGTFDGESAYTWILNVTSGEEEGVRNIALKVVFTAPGGKREVVLHTLQADRALERKEEHQSR